MNFIEKIIATLSWEMDSPKPFGLFHLISLAIIIATTIFICIKFKDANDIVMRRIVLICWIIMISFEFYKQIVFSYTPSSDVWDYEWYAFPFQLCSTPLFVLPFIAFKKDGKFRDAMMSYTSTFSLIGGLLTLAYPSTVFIEIGGINIQTMVHHGIQLLLGVYLFVYNRRKTNVKYFVRAIPIFLSLVTIAILLNEIMPALINPASSSDYFNMFYISPYYECVIPVLSSISVAVHPVLFIFIYALGFTLAGFIIYCILHAIKVLSCRKNSKND